MSNEAKLDALRWELAQQPASAKNWLELVRLLWATGSHGESNNDDDHDDAAAVATANAVSEVYERALRVLPYSYKLWSHYVRFRIEHTATLCRSSNAWFASVREVYERALQQLPHMPLLWLGYVEFVMSAAVVRVTMVRHLIAAALAALPATQHHLIWRCVKPWTRRGSTPHATARALWRAYLCFDTSAYAQREYLLLLLERGDTDGFMHHCVRMCNAHARAPTTTATATTSSSSSSSNSTAASLMPPAQAQLLDDVTFWELVTLAFRTPAWTYSGSLAELRVLAQHGEPRAASPSEFALAYALFLCGQGDVVGCRRVLHRLLRSAATPASFARVYATAVQLEDAVTQAFALHSQLRSSSSDDDDDDVEALRRVVASRLFADDDNDSTDATTAPLPLAPLRRLVDEHALWLNEAQLRGQPRSVALWLKRVELALARVHAGKLTYADVHALHRQAIAQCTAGLRGVPAAVAQLYESAVHALLCLDEAATTSDNNNNVQAAVALLLEGAWRTPFVSCAVNARLLGLLVEVRLLTAPPSNDDDDIAAAVLHDTLLPYLVAASTARHRDGGGGGGGGASSKKSSSSLLLLPSARHALPAVSDDARVWLLAWDMCNSSSSSGSSSADAWLTAYTSRGVAPACDAHACTTVEGLCYVAHALYTRAALAPSSSAAAATARAHVYACRVMDCALARSDGDAVARVFVVGQYVALLCAIHGTATLPLLRVRELLQHARVVAAAALPHAPHATIELFVNAALLEYRVGLHSVAVSTMQEIALLAVSVLLPQQQQHGGDDDAATSRRKGDEDSDDNNSSSSARAALLSLLAGLCEVSIEFVRRCGGMSAVRAYASTLLARAAVADAALLQRVVLHWAALEKRSGDVARAHAVLDACAESQDPRSAHGRVYWQLWQSLCSNVQEYTVVAQRRQHAEVRFRKQQQQRRRRRPRRQPDTEHDTRV